MSLYGGPGRYTNLVFAEDEDGLPPDWEPLNIEQGFPRGSNTLTVDVAGLYSEVWEGAAMTEDEAIKAGALAVRSAAIKDIARKYCRHHVEQHFTVNRMIDEYIKVYETIIETKKREDHRPWGYYKILADNTDYKVKEIFVFPNKRLCRCRLRQRDEHWYILNGTARVTLDDKTLVLSHGQSVNIPRGSLHRIANPDSENLRFIEVQTGNYFEEDDIERFEDDFGRI